MTGRKGSEQGQECTQAQVKEEGYTYVQSTIEKESMMEKGGRGTEVGGGGGGWRKESEGHLCRVCRARCWFLRRMCESTRILCDVVYKWCHSFSSWRGRGGYRWGKGWNSGSCQEGDKKLTRKGRAREWVKN